MLAPAINTLKPVRALAADYAIDCVSDRTFITEGQPIEVDSSLCSSLPDEIWTEGNANSYQAGVAGQYIHVANGLLPDNLVCYAVYNTIGREKASGALVGVSLRVSNIIKCEDSRYNPAWVGSNWDNVISFGNFSDYTQAFWLNYAESADVEYSFFYTDSPSETISLDNALVSVSSLDSFYVGSIGGKLHEAVVLPDNIEKLYKTTDCVVSFNGMLSGRNTYSNVCYGNINGTFGQWDSTYDLYNFSKHGFSWVNVGETIKLKFISLDGCFGTGITFQPIANQIPESPIKEYSIER